MYKKALLITVSTCALAIPARADDVGTVYDLGKVSISAPTPDQPEMGGSVISRDDILLFDRNTLDTAARLAPGVTTSLMGPRNETNIRIRGYGGTSSSSAQIPLSVDGIPVYLSYDDRLDFARFTTSDVGEIQISKSYTSVIAGPGAIGGAINLVSRQVTKPFEGDARLTTSFDQNGAFNGIITDVFAGSKMDNWYVQGSGTENYKNHFRLSDDFQPGTFENGGNRDHSYGQDYKVNFKIGYTPTATDEYSLNVIDQEGEKQQPLPDTKLPATMSCGMGGATALHCWTWPDWDNRSIFWLSKTALDDIGSYVKTRAYYEQFYNVLDVWDNLAETDMSTTNSEISTYDDRAAGGSVEVSKMLFGGADNLKAAFHFRWDEHNDQSQYRQVNYGPLFTSPWAHDDENTYSAAIENTYHPTQAWDITPGVSYDYRNVTYAEDWSSTGSGSMVHYPVSDKHAVNPQMLVAYHYTDSGSAHASFSDRTRFPTLFEMYSTRFGGAYSNPMLQPERALTWEGGVADVVGHTRLGANVFYSRLLNGIESVTLTNVSGRPSQDQNVGSETHKGFELEASSRVTPNLELGANYSFLIRKLSDAERLAAMGTSIVLTDTPKHNAFVYARWEPVSRFYVVPSLEYGGKQWFSSVNPSQPNYYYRGGDHALANLKVGYQVTNGLVFEAGVKNLFDENYAVEDGYAGEGRNLFATVRVSF